MCCSHFHMCREYPQRYDEYMKLNIAKEKETEWRLEELDKYYDDVLSNKENASLRIIHSSAAELVAMIKTADALRKTLLITQYIKDKVPFYDRVIVSETINGRADRKYHSGLIYLAYDLNEIEIAKAFVDLSLHFSYYLPDKSRDYDRCKEAAKLCIDIRDELNL